ncbi:fumarylacetoacetate hydrolase family protein [Marinoscillum furvescens]|uniref:2-keto-4-pentenoate hydratase/2-oxohepta-3-ene-1,7-dioic acid hydratase in catechol pathway n=1 Tax=Marinoscillum furvescens DSM 4134 TaxID=1122208 RepID=A0A3D9L3E0_MARFU|nr:fumarylacetoacetate hydrolase family protein [Marinoscillum furvescens]RED97480.1 2-keto-4-pentenoate hydratase/2-oxohepta-3-ene-1,7-dioic acid hydratase in catechol pathway [Marinoscillum furvescens DSM 4134]
MKIICIGRNYADHITELGNDRPENPVIFMKPDTAILRNNDPFYYPSFSENIHYECELLVKIKKEGKAIAAEFAHKYYDEIGLGIDFTARDLQSDLKAKGLPWELAKGFNGSAVVSGFVPLDGKDITAIHFELEKNGETVQQADTSLMLWPVDELIAYVSKYFTLKTGDILFTGTPKGVGPVSIGDRLVGKLEGQELFNFEVK